MAWESRQQALTHGVTARPHIASPVRRARSAVPRASRLEPAQEYSALPLHSGVRSEDVRRSGVVGGVGGTDFAAYDIHANARDEEVRRQYECQHSEWAASQPSIGAVSQALTTRLSRPSSAATRGAPMSFAALRPSLMRSATSACVSSYDPIGSRPTYTFSGPPTVYPYRFESKPEYQLPHLPQSLETRREPARIVPAKYADMRKTWLQTQRKVYE